MIKKFVNSTFLQLFSLVIIVVSFFHEVFRMQFWKDDYALLYNLQQKEPFYFPYHHMVDLHAPFFPLFGINPLGYFSLGVLFVFISSVVFYWFVYKLFSNKMIAFMASLIYITSPVGIDSVLMAMTFATDYFVLTLFLLILIGITTFYQKKKIIYYLFSIILLGVSIELMPYRTFYLSGVIILFEVINLKPSLPSVIKKLFNFLRRRIKSTSAIIIFPFSKKEKASVVNFTLRQLLLIFIWFFTLYIIPVYLLPDALKYHPETSAKLYQGIVDYRLVLNPLLSIVNILFAGIAYIFYQNFYVYNFSVAMVLLAITSLFFLYLLMRFLKKDKQLLNIFVFSVGYLYLTLLAFYPVSSREVMIAAHRYLTDSLPAYSILIICIYIFLSSICKYRRKLKLLPILFFLSVLMLNTYTTQIYLKDFNTRSYYSTQFSIQMKKFIPNLPKNSLIYIKPSDDADANYREVDTYRGGHYDERAYFAVLYNMKQEDLNPVITDYAILLTTYKKNPAGINKVFGFQNSPEGLTSIIQETRKSLEHDLGSTTLIEK